jgi:hypothetical protein
MAEKAVSFALLLGSLLSLYVCYRRFEPQTLVEIHGYFAGALIPWFVGVLWPSASRLFRHSPTRYNAARILLFCLAAGLWTLAARQIWMVEKSMIPVFKTTDLEGRKVAACLASKGGKTLFLIPDNNFRPVTVDSAIFKGGTDINRYYWGASAWIRNMFPDRGYLVGDTFRTNTSVGLAGYSKILFVSLPGERDAAVQRLKRTFGISLDEFTCSCTADFKFHVANVCYR